MMMNALDKSLTQVMLDSNLITEEQQQQILNEVEQTGISIEQAISKLVSSKALALAKKSVEYGVPCVLLEDVVPERQATERIASSFAYRNKVFPTHFEDGTLTVAMADPLDVMLIDEMRLVTECEILPVLAEESSIEEAIIRAYGKTAAALLSEGIKGPVGAVAALGRETIDDFGISEQDLTKDPTVVNAVDQIIIDAVRVGASDIHIEPFQNELRIRYRIDGVLENQPNPPLYLQSAITARIKIMSDGMNVAERRRPQDGKIGVTIQSVGNRHIDLRVSTVPTVHGESVVLRILDKQSISLGLEQLGLMSDNLKQFHRMIQKPHGIILATGPTGSGKTTTLYACLKEINTPDVKIITVEDPVEYELEGINQIQANPEIGVTFAAGLRHILRQDPDKILVGEIRDYETAEMAIHSALTGHLVFSSLHTNDAPSAITRLVDMDVEPYLVASTLEGVIAQRLGRRVCLNCREMYHPDVDSIRELLGAQSGQIAEDLLIPRAVGCKECRGRGYKGRIGIFEVLMMNEELREMTLQNASASQLRRVAMRHGMKSLREDGWRKVVAGYTTIEEVVRLTQEDEFDSGEVI
jgi:type II secretory ATPase GspE/PulE/Tfp pilus assembly ATPase PilB-like protein